MATSFKTSRTWLQKYFSEELPSGEVLADTLTFHVVEVDGVENKGDDQILDTQILPDRAGYLLSHRGIASEVAAALNIPMSSDPLRTPVPEFPTTDKLTVDVDTSYVLRHLGAIMRGVRVGPSPEWLKSALESVGQRSINNIVDATNYVMLNIGQPMHAFDLAKISNDAGTTRITIRRAAAGEAVTVLTGETYTLTVDMFVIADALSGQALDIAGLKGGAASGITEATTDLFVSVGTYDGTTIRKMSQALKLWTDASQRYQNKISPELGAYGMRDILSLIKDVAGADVEGVVDVYPTPPMPISVSVSLSRVNGILGTSYVSDDMTNALNRLSLPFEASTISSGELVVTITPPFERGDIRIPEDVADEVGRILGYENVLPLELPAVAGTPDQRAYCGIERIKDFLVSRGFTEISTQSFAPEGEILLANPLQADRPALRAGLRENMQDALARAVQQAPLVLGPDSMLKLFELGTVFPASGEHLSLVLGYKGLIGKESKTVLEEVVDALLEAFPACGLARPETIDTNVCELSLKDVNLESLGEGYLPAKLALSEYHPFSIYPFALRDVAVWTPEGTEESEVSLAIAGAAGDLLARMDRFDRFEKDGRISYAFRLVFQSSERTLSDADIDPVMQAVTDALNAKEDWEVR
ncbi:MAG: phenylalanine--tRNA ligase subunit beta [Patescibacteria group bacterium]